MISDSFENELAREIYMRDGSVKLNKPLNLARPAVALRGNNDLDELDSTHVKVLAYVCEKEDVKSSLTAIALGIEEDEVREYLHDLCLCKYVDENHKPTALGKKIVFEIGIEILGLDEFYMEGALKKTKWLLKYYRENH